MSAFRQLLALQTFVVHVAKVKVAKALALILATTALLSGCAASGPRYPSVVFVLDRLPNCTSEICGEWIVKSGIYVYTAIVTRSPEAEWQYEVVLLDPGNTNRFGFRSGDLVGRYNQSNQGRYVGEIAWRNALVFFGFQPSTLVVTGSDSFTLYNSAPSGVPIVAGEVQYARRLVSSASSEPISSSGKREISYGSGFIVSSDDHILTSEHVVDGCGTVQIRTFDGIKTHGKVVATDRTNDLAIIQSLKLLSNRIAKFRGNKPIRIGQPIAVVGYPLGNLVGEGVKATIGNISGLTGLAGDTRAFQISAPIQIGNSGGPLVDMSGNVAGVVSYKLSELYMAKITGSLTQNVNFAIKASTAKTFLDSNQINYLTEESRETGNPEDAIEKSSRYTVQIICVA